MYLYLTYIYMYRPTDRQNLWFKAVSVLQNTKDGRRADFIAFWFCYIYKPIIQIEIRNKWKKDGTKDWQKWVLTSGRWTVALALIRSVLWWEGARTLGGDSLFLITLMSPVWVSTAFKIVEKDEDAVLQWHRLRMLLGKNHSKWTWSSISYLQNYVRCEKNAYADMMVKRVRQFFTKFSEWDNARVW